MKPRFRAHLERFQVEIQRLAGRTQRGGDARPDDAKIVRHDRYVILQAAEGAVPRQMFAEILSLPSASNVFFSRRR